MANYLRPRRGKRATATSTLTASNPLKRGEVFFEVPTGGIGSGAGNIVMGDGATKYDSLPYFINGSLIGTTNISSIGNGTITGAISQLNNDLSTLIGRIDKWDSLYDGPMGTNASVQTTYAISSYDKMLLRIKAGDTVLNTCFLKVGEFNQHIILRCFYFDTVKLYYQDMEFVDDRHVKLTAINPDLTCQLIGFD